MFKHNLQSAMVAADGIRKMDAIYEDAIEAHEPDLSELGKELWKVFQELVILLATNFMKIVFPGFSVERVCGKIFLHDSNGSDLLSMYDGQIEDGIVYREPSGVQVNLKECPESIVRILPPEITYHLLCYDEEIDLDKFIDRQHKIIRDEKYLSEIYKNFSDFPTIGDKALWLITAHKIGQEIKGLLVFDASDKERDFDKDCYYHKRILDEVYDEDGKEEEYYIDDDGFSD